MSDFFDELTEGEIHLRDKYQLELKSQYSPVKSRKESSYISEFYVFIPSQLQINQDSYSKKQFYRDQLSLIRYKTPNISFKELLSDDNARSPLVVLKKKMKEEGEMDLEETLFEIKLFANIVRSQLRDQVREIAEAMDTVPREELNEKVIVLCGQLQKIKGILKEFYHHLFAKGKNSSLKYEWDYVDEFLSITIEHYLSSLLKTIRVSKDPVFNEVDKQLCAVIIAEEQFRQKKKFGTIFDPKQARSTSKAIYRMTLLNKYIFNVLFLSIVRKVPRKGVAEIAAAFAAGLAMFIYLFLLTLQGTDFLIDSTAFIVLSVLLYVLKDRIKESVRTFSTKKAAKWFADYTTDIKLKDKGETIGRLKEYFTFLEREKVSKDVIKVRENEFEDELDRIKRVENVIYYKKDVQIWPEAVRANRRLRRVNDIFRYNLSQYFLKASDAKDNYPFLNPETEKIQNIECSRVYHVNIILKKTYITRDDRKKIEFSKFRVVIDKEGIRRVDKV